MDATKSKKFSGYIALLILLVLLTCVPLATDLREKGFDQIQKGFESLKVTEDLYEVIELNNIKIHVVGDRKKFKWEKAAAYGSPVAGYATNNNEIWVLGKVVKGKIIINQAILGHELNHLLNIKDPRVANPDDLEDLGV